MSLGVYLAVPKYTPAQEAEINAAVATLVSHDVELQYIPLTERMFSRNITHNLGNMAEALGVYKECWRPEEIGITKAAQLTQPLKRALVMIRSKPENYRKFEPANKWGTVESFTAFLQEYLDACIQHPEADVSVSR